MNTLPRLFVLCALLGCDPQRADWGLGAITTAKTPTDDPSLACGVALPVDKLAEQRAACAFSAGTYAETSLGVTPTTAAAIPIRHVIILMKENRSFDHLLGKLHDQGQPLTDAIPAGYANDDANGVSVAPFHQTNTCLAQDPFHQSTEMAVCVNGGKMDGFVRNAANGTNSDGHWAMGVYEKTELPFTYWLASNWALADRHFAPMVSGTYGNRNFLLFGDNATVVATGIVFPPPNTPSLLHLLLNAGYTWGAYSDSEVFSGAMHWQATDPGVHTIAEFFDAVDKGTLPNVAFVDADEYITDDHPDADLQAGEAWTKKVYDHVVKSPQWPRLALFWTFDEGGAFFDHVPPPQACRASENSPFTDLGTRIPFVAISPWAKRHFVSHVVHDHTAMTRFIELIFHLPALSTRDANSDALLELFDFSCGRDLSFVDPPAAGTGACVDPASPGTH